MAGRAPPYGGWSGCGEEGGAGFYQDGLAAQAGGEGVGVDAGGAHPEAGAAVGSGARHLEPVCRDGAVQHAAAFVVGAGHAADQGVVVAEAQEIGGGALDVPRRVAQDAGPQRPGRRDERRGADEVAEPETGEDRFGEGADVDHPPGFIHGFQGGGGGAKEGHLEFIIILDDQHVVGLGPVQQRLTAGVRHGGGRGALVAGGGENDVGVGGDGGGVEAVCVQGEGDQGGVGLLEEGAEGGVAGILDHRVAVRGEQLRGEPEGVLRTHGQ